ncbi:cytosine/adenosine deaminase-related metal-dependent hydrolase [Maritalea mobilis]|uniref:Cytosine/adenosine deaminase-related metal-dependent hydrolase n=1 Tax=Maritalea mobilis TaxID=483324 RepID=A0A4R6VSP0_9HYPH|nr:amidohydrolase family protein [Maritalea mobilis]TDQ67073.1 cytosine/adenosine deaminase-related metal-dependent hydrolase [Maritalea mobilis]
MTDKNNNKISVIRNIDWLVAWDEAAQKHYYLRNGDLAYKGNEICYIGKSYDGHADSEIDGRNFMVMPGFVDIHAHSGDEPMAKGVFDDIGTPALYGQALYEYSGVLDFDDNPEALEAGLNVMLADLMKSGVTTLMDLTRPHDRWIDTMYKSGIRGYVAPGFREASWHVHNSHRLDFIWDEAKGRDAFERAKACVKEAEDYPSDRIRGALAPSQIETCSEKLLADGAAAAKSMGVPLTIHAAQTMAEHEELLQRHGMTAPQYLNSLGVLGPNLVLGHCIFLDHHSWTRQRTENDLALLAETGTSVAHCPVAFARSGMTLQTIGRYQRAGVNLGIGTDTYPNNYTEEMRIGMLAARISAKSVFDVSTADIFNAATIGGAKALQRDDIGRLKVGAKADMVLVNTNHPSMLPVYDPIRSFLHNAADRAISHVIVDGDFAVRDGEHCHIDHQANAEILTDAQNKAVAKAPQNDPQHRSMDVLAPLTFESR